MRLLQFVIFTLIVVYPEDVLSSKGPKRRTKAKGPDNQGPCGKRYLRQINGKCYYFAGKKMNWYGAQNNCLRKNLNLADLATEAEFNSIIKFLRSRGNMEDYWFGGNDLQTEGRFTYISNGRPVRYLGGIEAIEPTHRSNLDDCLEIRLRQNSTAVTDDNCQEQQYFVCQLNAVKCAQPTADQKDNQHHSHEHLHHFHHDAAKGEGEPGGKGSNQESLESDSRPADNSNSTEVGESVEEKTSAEGEEGPAESVEDAAAEPEEGETPADGEETAAREAPAEGATGEPTSENPDVKSPAETEAGEATLPAEEGKAPVEGGEETAAPAEGAQAPAPTEGGEALAPAEGQETAKPAEGGEAPAAEEAPAARAPKARDAAKDAKEAGTKTKRASEVKAGGEGGETPAAVKDQKESGSPKEVTPVSVDVGKNAAEVAKESEAGVRTETAAPGAADPVGAAFAVLTSEGGETILSNEETTAATANEFV